MTIWTVADLTDLRGRQGWHVHPATVYRALQAMDDRFRRPRHDLTHRQDAEAVASAKRVLAELQKRGLLAGLASGWSTWMRATSTPVGRSPGGGDGECELSPFPSGPGVVGTAGGPHHPVLAAGLHSQPHPHGAGLALAQTAAGLSPVLGRCRGAGGGSRNPAGSVASPLPYRRPTRSPPGQDLLRSRLAQFSEIVPVS